MPLSLKSSNIFKSTGLNIADNNCKSLGKDTPEQGSACWSLYATSFFSKSFCLGVGISHACYKFNDPASKSWIIHDAILQRNSCHQLWEKQNVILMLTVIMINAVSMCWTTSAVLNSYHTSSCLNITIIPLGGCYHLSRWKDWGSEDCLRSLR